MPIDLVGGQAVERNLEVRKLNVLEVLVAVEVNGKTRCDWREGSSAPDGVRSSSSGLQMDFVQQLG